MSYKIVKKNLKQTLLLLVKNKSILSVYKNRKTV